MSGVFVICLSFVCISLGANRVMPRVSASAKDIRAAAQHFKHFSALQQDFLT
ncbi:hypothetical protein Z947_3279 [Sulfitobacter geojensis]|jgi:hypothetical protein|nr:hypothetical protein Z947_3279 [Sulfitobacter geojensis]